MNARGLLWVLILMLSLNTCSGQTTTILSTSTIPSSTTIFVTTIPETTTMLGTTTVQATTTIPSTTIPSTTSLPSTTTYPSTTTVPGTGTTTVPSTTTIGTQTSTTTIQTETTTIASSTTLPATTTFPAEVEEKPRRRDYMQIKYTGNCVNQEVNITATDKDDEDRVVRDGIVIVYFMDRGAVVEELTTDDEGIASFTPKFEGEYRVEVRKSSRYYTEKI